MASSKERQKREYTCPSIPISTRKAAQTMTMAVMTAVRNIKAQKKDEGGLLFDIVPMTHSGCGGEKEPWRKRGRRAQWCQWEGESPTPTPFPTPEEEEREGRKGRGYSGRGEAEAWKEGRGRAFSHSSNLLDVPLIMCVSPRHNIIIFSFKTSQANNVRQLWQNCLTLLLKTLKKNL